jgi:transcriptional regulator with XRE-family HTH domain/tetratricopeptide (TPR) repeat protein
MAEEAVVSFAALLKRLRVIAAMTQEELASAAGIHVRTISDLERGVALRAHRTTIQLLEDALRLEPKARAEFEAAARGRHLLGALATPEDRGEELDGDPKSWMRRIVTALDQLGAGAARSLATEWQASAVVDPDWLRWVDELIGLTVTGRLDWSGQRPLPAAGGGVFWGRDAQIAELDAFLERVQAGRGGLALIVGPVRIGKSRLLAEVLAKWSGVAQTDWVTLDRGEAGYRGWRRLLAPPWIELRREELAPAKVLPYAKVLDEVLLPAGDGDETGLPFPGEVAAAIAALLKHMARRCPVVVVLDDAHRGGASSDQLLVEVARRVSASAVGIIAALRQSELEEPSALRAYADQGESRAALDLVVPVHVPPLGPESVAGLISERTGVAPPPEVVDQVMKQTAGRPQLIKYSPILPPDGASASSRWVVGRPSPDDRRGLQYIVMQRSRPVRNVLEAAAVCATGQEIDAPLVARVAELRAGEVERVLDEERRHGSILASRLSGYWFQHDSWMDAIAASCPAERLRTLHARCLSQLREDPTCAPQLLARHALAAGAAAVGEQTIVALSKNAAEAALADRAFSAAADFYAAAAQFAEAPERIELLVSQADAWRFGGSWEEARAVLKRAAAQARALGDSGREALAMVHLERLTWNYGLDEKELTEQIRGLLRRLPSSEVVLRAQAEAGLAARLAISVRQYENEQIDLAEAALEKLPSIPLTPARADVVVGVRHGLQDHATPDELLEYDREVLDLGMKFHSAFHIQEALVAQVMDLVRAGRLIELPAAVRAHRDFTEYSASPQISYSQALIDSMLALAHGDFSAASAHTAEASALSADWGESMAREALMAQAGWLLFETGQLDGLAELLEGLPDQDVSSLNEPVWHLGAGLIHAERGEVDVAIRILRDVCAITGDFANLARGPSRIGILATAATLLGHPSLYDSLPHADAVRWGHSLASLLHDHPDAIAVAGWPAVILGSKHRFIGLAYLAAGEPAEARPHLERAAEQNSAFAVLHARTRFDLARALLQQGSGREGMAELKRALELASRLGMTRLAAQAADELGART